MGVCVRLNSNELRKKKKEVRTGSRKSREEKEGKRRKSKHSGTKERKFIAPGFFFFFLARAGAATAEKCRVATQPGVAGLRGCFCFRLGEGAMVGSDRPVGGHGSLQAQLMVLCSQSVMSLRCSCS